MDFFKILISNILNKIMINPKDSDVVKAKKIIWYTFFGSFLIVLIVSWIIFSVFTVFDNEVKVPMIVGDDIYEALTKLSEKKLIAVVTQRHSDKYEAGIVFRQRPSGGEKVNKGRPVSFFVSLGSIKSSLDDYVGLTLFELEDFFDKNYENGKPPFKIEKYIYEFNNDVEKGRIFKQEPSEGTPLYKVKKVKLWISNGIEDKEEKLLKNYVGKNIEEVSKELSDMELTYSYDFSLVQDKDKDMIITDQSIGEGKLISEIIEEGKVILFKVNKYEYIDGEKIKGTYLLDLPKKALPFMLEVKIRTGNSKEKTILKRELKGGVSIPVPYSAKKDSLLIIYIDGNYEKEITLKIEEESEE